MRVILASKSPRRKEILENLGIKFDIIVSDADENSKETDPSSLVCDLSFRKATAVSDTLLPYNSNEETYIIACDTVVALEGEIFGKPENKEHAKDMLSRLSDKTHKVFSGVTVIKINQSGEISHVTDFEDTGVKFSKMSDEDIEFYISNENVFDKAGAYAIQGLASIWIEKIDGCYFNVVGLPIKKTAELLKKMGCDVKNVIQSR